MAGPSDSDGYVEPPQGHGHLFIKKTFHKPTYCHHCAEILWGIIGQGFVCEVCNFVIHERCVKTVTSPCVSIAGTLVKNPVAHCWSEPGHFRRKFCSVCRKRLDDTTAVHCEVCECYVHVSCYEYAVTDCKECATYIPKVDLPNIVNFHHWREGNLPSNSKCVVCKKGCWSSECLAGMRCEWCGYTSHATCVQRLSRRCTFGCLESIMIPPSCVSIPRTEVAMETIIGVQTRRKEAQGISDDFSSSGDIKSKDVEDHPTGGKEKEGGGKEKESNEETLKVFDGNTSKRRRVFRIITIPKTANRQKILDAALRTLHVSEDTSLYYVTDALDLDEKELDEESPLQNITRIEGKRPAIFLRFRNDVSDKGFIKVYPGRLRHQESFRSIAVTSDTTVDEVIVEAINRFQLEDTDPQKYRLLETSFSRGVSERQMEGEEKPWEVLKQVGRESLRYMQLTRFYIQQKEDPHGSTIALFVGNLPPNLSQRQYEKILTDFVGIDNKFSLIGPIYYEYGSMILTYESCSSAVQAFDSLQECSYEDKHILVLLLPSIQPRLLPENVLPLLVFVNVKSGGCQGLQLIASFRKLLNPYQVFDLENGGPLPGLYVFRHIKYYKILVCGGDGTIGWVLQCLDNVGQDSECQSPACAIVPLGTGNDLARVLRWGPGYTGGEDPLNLLKDVIEAEEIRLDRWTVVFHPEEKPETKEGTLVVSQATSEDNTQIFVMNNYFGIGIDADLCLDFHNAREENPDKFNSRLHNKGVYVKMGIRKMMSRKMCKDMHKEIKLEVDGKVVDLPSVEGIIILNILSWGSGANPWGPDKEDQFSKPNHYDGMLEVVGVSGVVHLGQIQSGLRSATRIAQGGHIKIRINKDLPVQVDGEPWIQSPSEVVILKSALKATMLKKMKGKMKRRNTVPSIVAMGTGQGGNAAETSAVAGNSATNTNSGPL